MSQSKNATAHDELEVRIDKWLWAARFFKTRSIAREMVQGGKVHYNGQRVKPSKVVDVGATIKITTGFEEKTVVIDVITDKRRNFTFAQTMYTETEESIEQREKRAIARKNNTLYSPRPETKPDKKQRRELLKIKHHD
ncbi:ribosome-associated heat shock protein Hsp15 [Flocculibacter collagenilyticus]|uniref:ribosome-associated heat shock protein Hsp15 n=1 Tax=Flocculibacter collagenilyticus TaxID=2744479 RepID=UPI0018F2CC1E|nr:ribosome-associated heat shock protein Hsp15 [Flocculibacter collagenilyticus]